MCTPIEISVKNGHLPRGVLPYIRYVKKITKQRYKEMPLQALDVSLRIRI